MKLTLPQIIMLNHGASVNQQRSEERTASKKAVDEEVPEQEVTPEDLEGFMAQQWGMVLP